MGHRLSIGAQQQQPERGTIRGRWRLFSAGYYPDFDLDVPEDVLEASLPLWQPRPDTVGAERRVPILTDHRLEAAAWLGQVESAEWAAAADDRPAGIDGDIAISEASDPRIVAGVTSGSLRAVSAGLDFECDQSHPGMAEAAFVAALGSTVDGAVVRWVATEVTEVREVSVVWDGADPYARRLDASRAPVAALRINAAAPAAPVAEEAAMPSMESGPMAEAMGLAAEATPEEFLARVGQLVKRETALASVVELIRSSEMAGEETTDGEDVAEQAVAAARRLKAQTSAQRDTAAAASVEQAIAAGKFAADKRAELTVLARRDPAGFAVAVGAVAAQGPQPPVVEPLRPQAGSRVTTAAFGRPVPDARRLKQLGFKDADEFIRYADAGRVRREG